KGLGAEPPEPDGRAGGDHEDAWELRPARPRSAHREEVTERDQRAEHRAADADDDRVERGDRDPGGRYRAQEPDPRHDAPPGAGRARPASRARGGRAAPAGWPARRGGARPTPT